MNRRNHRECLLLNADYSPLYIIGWKKSIIWQTKYMNMRYGVEILDFYKKDYICGVNNKKYPLPAVAKTYKFFKTHRDSVPFSRKNIFIRDNYICQYCNGKLSHNELTYDHVVPKVMWDYTNGSPTRWTNIVTSCTPCNRKKGGRTPRQANMILQNLPDVPDKNPKYLSIVQILSKIHDVPEEWLLYLPKSYTYA